MTNKRAAALGFSLGALTTLAVVALCIKYQVGFEFEEIGGEELPADPPERQNMLDGLVTTDTKGNVIDTASAIGKVTAEALQIIAETHDRIATLCKNLEEQGPSARDEFGFAVEADHAIHHLMDGINSGALGFMIPKSTDGTPVNISAEIFFKQVRDLFLTNVRISRQARDIFWRAGDEAIQKARETHKLAVLSGSWSGQPPQL